MKKRENKSKRNGNTFRKRSGRRQDDPKLQKLKDLQRRHQIKTSAKARPMVPMNNGKEPYLLCPDTGVTMSLSTFNKQIQ